MVSFSKHGLRWRLTPCLATIPSGFEINDIEVWTKPVCYNGFINDHTHGDHSKFPRPISLSRALWLALGEIRKLFKGWCSSSSQEQLFHDPTS